MSKIYELLKSEYPQDVATIKSQLPSLSFFPDLVIEKLWEKYSDHLCAGWIIVDKESIEDFERWLQ